MSPIESIFIKFDKGRTTSVAVGIALDEAGSTPIPQDLLLLAVSNEQKILSRCMQTPSAWAELCDHLQSDDFSDKCHRELFKIMDSNIQKGQSIDVVTLSESIDRLGQLDEIGGLDALIELARMPCPIDITESIEIVRAFSLVRKLIEATARSISINLKNSLPSS